jgi:hypothetical protein
MRRFHPTDRPTRARKGRSLAILRELRASKSLVVGALVAFVAAVIVAPCLHTYDHRDDHTHGPDGRHDVGASTRRERIAHLLAHAEGRAHEHHSVGSPRAVRVAPTAPHIARLTRYSTSESEGLPAPHGRGALEHFGVALTSNPNFIFTPAPPRTIKIEAQHKPDTWLPSFPSTPHQPRGPPASSVRVPSNHRC